MNAPRAYMLKLCSAPETMIRHMVGSPRTWRATASNVRWLGGPVDEYALASQQRTARAQQEGSFKDELATMRAVRGILDEQTGQVVGREEHTIDRDECNRPDTTREGLLAPRPHFDPKSGQGTVTAGN